MKTNNQSPTSQQLNKKRKYSSNSDTDSGISVEPDIVLVQDELCSSPELGQVVEPKKPKMPPKLKQTSVQSFFGKTKSPAAKPSGDDEVMILECKQTSKLDSSRKPKDEVTIIEVKNKTTAENPKVKKEIIAVDVSESPVKNEEKKDKYIRYSDMVTKALQHLNTQGEGCSKLQILVYILKKFQPSDDIIVINEKLGKLLDKRVRKGTLLSNENLPKDSGKSKTKFQKAVTVNKKMIKKEPTSPKKAKKKEPENKKKEAASKAKAMDVQKPLNTSKPLILNPTLAIICGAKKLTIDEIKKKVWVYVNTNNLRDPKDKSFIKCDKKLKKLTKQKTIHVAAFFGHIKKSLTPDVIDGVASAEPTTTLVGSTTPISGSSPSIPGSMTSVAGSSTPITVSTAAVVGSANSSAGSNKKNIESTTLIDGSATKMIGSTTSIAGSTTIVTGSVTSVSGSTTTMVGSATSVNFTTATEASIERAKQINSFVHKVAVGVYTCRECGYASTRHYNIKKHAEVHLSPDHYKCPICQELFGKEVNFKFHMRRTHQVNTYSPRKKKGIQDYSSMQR